MKKKNNFIILLGSAVIILIFLGFVMLDSNQPKPQVEGISTSWLFNNFRFTRATPMPVVVNNAEIDRRFKELDSDAANLDKSLNDKAIDVLGQ
jgi:hypothetical protein